jgi:hypothetical protein
MYDRLHENCFQNGKLHPFTDDECLRSYSKNDIRAVFPEFDEASKIDTDCEQLLPLQSGFLWRS